MKWIRTFENYKEKTLLVVDADYDVYVQIGKFR
jgi:hypothetical protein